MGAIVGNYLTIAMGNSGAFATLVHLRAGSIRVAAGDQVTTGQQLAECGNSGNSTQPHVHVQVMDNPDVSVAQGLPLAFGSAEALVESVTRPHEEHRVRTDSCN